SLVYNHYHSPPEIKIEDGTVKYVFTCKCHGTTHIYAHKDTSITNLKNHAKHCDMKAQNTKLKQPKINEVISSYNYGEFRLLHVEWFTESHHPDMMIKDPGLQRIYCHLNPQVKICFDKMVSCNIKETFEVTKERLKELLREHEGCFHIIFNAWAAPNSHDFLGTVLIWCCNGHIEVVTLDMIE
ncbi:hypothetical protein EDD18DRAFT_1092071, partial [Armillaria luteobubalina]